jgi:hypothetical protein
LSEQVERTLFSTSSSFIQAHLNTYETAVDQLTFANRDLPCDPELLARAHKR